MNIQPAAFVATAIMALAVLCAIMVPVAYMSQGRQQECKPVPQAPAVAPAVPVTKPVTKPAAKPVAKSTPAPKKKQVSPHAHY